MKRSIDNDYEQQSLLDRYERVLVDLWTALRTIQPYPPTLDRIRGVPALDGPQQIQRYCGAIKLIYTRAVDTAEDYMPIYQYHYWLVVYNANMLPEPARSAAKLACKDHPLMCDAMTSRAIEALNRVMPWHIPFFVDEFTILSAEHPLELPTWYASTPRRVINKTSRAFTHFVTEMHFGDLRDYMIYARRVVMAQGRRGAFVLEARPARVTIRWANVYDLMYGQRYRIDCAATFGDAFGRADSCDVLFVWRRRAVDNSSVVIPFQFHYSKVESVEARHAKYKGDTPAGARLSDIQMQQLYHSSLFALHHMNNANEAMGVPATCPPMALRHLRDTIIEYNARCDHCGVYVTFISHGCSYRYYMGRIDESEPYSYANCRLLCWSCGVQSYRYLGTYTRIPCSRPCTHAIMEVDDSPIVTELVTSQ